MKSPLNENMWFIYMCVTLRPRDDMEHVVLAKAYKDHRGSTMYRQWFYYEKDPDCNMHNLRTEISYFGHLKVALDDHAKMRMKLLKTIAAKASMRDLCKEFFAAIIMPLRRNSGSVLVHDPVIKERTFIIEKLLGITTYS